MKTILVIAGLSALLSGCGETKPTQREVEVQEAKTKLSEKSLERAEKVVELYCGAEHVGNYATQRTLEMATGEPIVDELSCRLAVYSKIDNYWAQNTQRDGDRLDYAPLSYFTEIISINVARTDLSSLNPLLEPMRALPNLEVLVLEGNRLSSLQGLANAAPGLEKLNLTGNRFAALDAGHPNVTELDLSNNPLQTLVGLRHFPKVYSVNLGTPEFRLDFDWDGLKLLSGVVSPTLRINRTATIAGLTPEESRQQIWEHKKALDRLDGPRISEEWFGVQP